MIARLAAMQKAFPDASVELGDVIVEGDLVAFRSILRGTHRAAFRDLAPAGRTFAVHLVDLVRVRASRILP